MIRRTALITGGAGGIGEAIARALSRDGMRILITYRTRRERAEKLAAELDGEAMRADFSTEEGLAAAIESVRSRSIDVLVNNAGIAAIGLLQETEEARIREILRVDLETPIRLARAVLPHMLTAGWGRIVNVSSIWGVAGGSCETVYSAAKAGLIGFTKSLAREVGPSGITVNAVVPGVIDTEMNASLGTETLDALKAETPVGRLGRPDEVADAVSFLVKSDFVTAETLGVHGGIL